MTALSPIITKGVHNLERNLADKVDRLKNHITSMGKVAILLSGGVDSTFLAEVSRRTLGSNAIAITFRSSLAPAGEAEEAVKWTELAKMKHYLIDSDEFGVDQVRANGPDRCYYCRKHRQELAKAWAEKTGWDGTFCDGANADDLSDYRPGLRAADEAGVRHPLAEVGFSKAEIRSAAKAMGLECWNRPSSPCLASRFPYGFPLSAELLKMVEASERSLREMGFSELRVRCFPHGLAVVEVSPEEMDRAWSLRRDIASALRGFGFSFVAMDLEGHVGGKLNRLMQKESTSSPGDQNFKGAPR
ncbi:MAG TPA: ATP-dependent sacrificial sulfur transferase LarE [Thermosynergistes sp.]|nr:ATP-dependent sacrificial sulfur transferase LarE [Thermosynergistes sp.]